MSYLYPFYPRALCDVFQDPRNFKIYGSKTSPKCTRQHTDLDAVGDVRLDVNAEPVDAVDGFLQFVGARLLLRVFQALGAERAQQQSKKQIEHL